jgi:hypothetical protein
VISLTLNRKALLAAGACATGLALFEALVTAQDRKHSVYVKDWTPTHDTWLRAAYPDFAGWLQARGLIPCANLCGANLDGANLTRADLCGANLDGANLTRANLTRANLCGANLCGANLTRANLTRADLYGANLTRADLCGANLDGANLTRANLTRANRWASDPPIVGWRLVDGILLPGER